MNYKEFIFIMNNLVTKTLSLPDWYPQAFSHLGAEEYAIVCQIWQREPMLRKLAAELDKYHPPQEMRGIPSSCHEVRSMRLMESTHQEYYCRLCRHHHSYYAGTPFHQLDSNQQARLYAVLVTLWGCWRIEEAMWISGCYYKKSWRCYCQRLKPILMLIGKRSVTPNPRYLLGFMPGQQGIHCPVCRSSQLSYVEEMPAGNPMVHCEACQHQFVIYPEIPKGIDPFAEKTPYDEVPVPDWFQRLFAHTTQAQYQHLRCVWQREPVLRALADRLDEQNPSLGGVYECPWCGNRRLTAYVREYHHDEYYCRACDKTFSASVGSVFYRLQEKYYYRLYSVLVMLWTQWRPANALVIGKLRKLEVFNYYRKRLQPLFDELGDQPITPYPRYMSGFKPGRQGVCCIHCQSANLDIVGVVTTPDNPNICCLDCGSQFRLHVWRWQFLPDAP